MTDDAYGQLMNLACRLAKDGHGETAQHLRDAIDEAKAKFPLPSAIRNVRASAAALGLTIEEWERKFGARTYTYHGDNSPQQCAEAYRHGYDQALDDCLKNGMQWAIDRCDAMKKASEKPSEAQMLGGDLWGGGRF